MNELIINSNGRQTGIANISIGSSGLVLAYSYDLGYVSLWLSETGSCPITISASCPADLMLGILYGVDGAVPVLAPATGGSIVYANGQVPTWQSKAGTIDAVRLLTSDGLNWLVWQ